jgi:hypothetical protein
MLTIFAAAVGFLIGGLAGAAWAVVILYVVTFLIMLAFGS